MKERFSSVCCNFQEESITECNRDSLIITADKIEKKYYIITIFEQISDTTERLTAT